MLKYYIPWNAEHFKLKMNKYINIDTVNKISEFESQFEFFSAFMTTVREMEQLIRAQ